MKLLYILNQRLPIEKAYGLQVAKMCEAFADYGLNVNLVFPTRKDPIKQDFFNFYSIKRSFGFKKLSSPDFYFPGKLDKIAVAIKSFISALVLVFYSIFRKTDLIYSRDELPLYFLSFFKKNLVFEAHRFSEKRAFFYRKFKNKNLKIITISKGLENKFINFGFKSSNILVAHDGVDLKEFNVDISKEKAREKLNLPQDKILLGYVGQLKTMGMEKGIDFVFEALKRLPENVIFILVGGEDGDIKFYKKLSEGKNLSRKVLFIGRVKHNLIPYYLKCFNILLMPFPNIEHYAFYMSPLKLFEYMASRRPIVATNLPTIREVLNEENSVLVKPDDPDDFARGIKKILEDSNLAEKINKKAFEDVKNYTWQKRAERILEFIQ